VNQASAVVEQMIVEVEAIKLLPLVLLRVGVDVLIQFQKMKILK